MLERNYFQNYKLSKYARKSIFSPEKKQLSFNKTAGITSS